MYVECQKCGDTGVVPVIPMDPLAPAGTFCTCQSGEAKLQAVQRAAAKADEIPDFQ
ncbi:MAG TPA: hypothetical protein VI756_15430 [Blastocatellia bacterium]